MTLSNVIDSITVAATTALNVLPFLPRVKRVPTTPFTEDARVTLDCAAEKARLRGTDPVNPDHILLVLISDHAGPAAQLRSHIGIDQSTLQAQLRSLAFFANGDPAPLGCQASTAPRWAWCAN